MIMSGARPIAFGQAITPPQSPRLPRPERLGARRRMGFTLIELIISVAVLAILTTLAAPSFQQMLARNRVSGLASELSAALNLARSEAIKRGRTMTLCKCATPTATDPTCDTSTAATWPEGWLVFVDEDRDGVRDTGEELLKVGQPATRNAIQTGLNFIQFVSFLPNGGSSATGAEADRTLTLCVAPEQRRLIINRTGQIRVLRGSCT